VITDLVRREVRSYRTCPINLYHSSRSSGRIRPRFGLMRSREFEMKDAYTMDADEEAANKSYWPCRGLHPHLQALRAPVSSVEADSGAIGGSYSHDSWSWPTGRDAVVIAGMQLRREPGKAELTPPAETQARAARRAALRKGPDPGYEDGEAVTAFLRIKPEQLFRP
jgi:prolyl-tRNA synthetase